MSTGSFLDFLFFFPSQVFLEKSLTWFTVERLASCGKFFFKLSIIELVQGLESVVFCFGFCLLVVLQHCVVA